MSAKLQPGRPGDRLQVSSLAGGPTRSGHIVEVLGSEHHEHYLVRWDDEHQSIHYPSEGTRIVKTAKSADSG